MTTDRELLEAAAKAAGWERMPAGTVDKAMAGWLDTVTGRMHWDDTWNPLTDDGDALRLVNKLRMRIEHHIRHPFVAAFAGKDLDAVKAEEPHGSDCDAATRRAIVRAAAALQTDKESP